MRPFQLLFLTAIIVLRSYVLAVPIDSTGNVTSDSGSSTEIGDAPEAPEETKQPTTPGPNSEELESSNSQPHPSYVLPEHHGPGGPAHFDPSIYAGYLTPEAFQQYLGQFAGTFSPYAYPGYAAAPAPVYPGPYAVQTGYDGFLVPSVSASLEASGSTSSTSLGSTILTALQNLIPTLLSSTVVQMIMTALTALLMVLFGGAITTAICNLTPICDISFKAVSYLRGNGAGDMGRMLAEEITPERVRRASEFVRNAIYKYKQMQKMLQPEDKVEARDLE